MAQCCMIPSLGETKETRPDMARMRAVPETGRDHMPNPLVKLIAVFLAVLSFSSIAPAQRGGPPPPGFIAAGVPKMPDPPGPAPKRDLSGAWVGPQNYKL